MRWLVLALALGCQPEDESNGLPSICSCVHYEFDPTIEDRIIVPTDDSEVDPEPQEFFLSLLPLPSTVAVSVEVTSGVVYDLVEAVSDPPIGDWIYDPSRNSIVLLTFEAEGGSIVTIRYVPDAEI